MGVPPIATSVVTIYHHHPRTGGLPRGNTSSHTASAMSTRQQGMAFNGRVDDALPRELIVSIQRVLDLRPGPDTDPMDDLSENFSPIGVLNEFFPDGKLLNTCVYCSQT